MSRSRRAARRAARNKGAGHAGKRAEAVWWARHELREAEELCCDGWVVWAMPGAGRAYAAALIECLDFLSGVPRPLLVGANGLGHIDDLKRRLKMILSGTISRRLTWAGAAMLFGVGAMLLPLVPAWSQDRKEEKPREEKAQPERKPDSPETQKARAEVEKLRAELEEQVKKVQAAEEKLRAAAAQLHKLEGKGGDVRILIIRDGDQRAGQREFDRRIERPREGRPGEPGRGGDPGRREGGDRDRPMPPREGDRRPEQGGDRFQDLERKLENIMRELEEMRRQMRQQGPRGPGGPGSGGPGGAGGAPGGRPGGAGGPGDTPKERRPGPREEKESAAPRSPFRLEDPAAGKPRP